LFRFAHGTSGTYGQHFAKRGFEFFVLSRVPAAQCRQALSTPAHTMARIDTEQGKGIFARRLGIVEPVFANLCVHKRMHRFTLRSKRKWMYNGRVRDSRWFTILARSMSLRRCPSPSSPPSACPFLFSLNIRALSPANPLQTGFFDSLVGLADHFSGEIN